MIFNFPRKGDIILLTKPFSFLYSNYIEKHPERASFSKFIDYTKPFTLDSVTITLPAGFKLKLANYWANYDRVKFELTKRLNKGAQRLPKGSGTIVLDMDKIKDLEGDIIRL